MPKYYIRDSQEGKSRTNIELSVVSAKSVSYQRRKYINFSQTGEFYPFEFFKKHCPQFLRTFGLEDEEIKPYEDESKRNLNYAMDSGVFFPVFRKPVE